MKEARMPTDEKPKTGKLNGPLWGARARDWSDLQEPMTRRVYDAVFQRLGVGAHTNYLDVGCGSGLAAQLAAEQGAKVSGVDAAENLLAIAQSRVAGQFRVADLEELPFADKTFDIVTGFNSFRMPVPTAFAQAKCRKVGGAVVIVIWANRRDAGRDVDGRPEGHCPAPAPGTPVHLHFRTSTTTGICGESWPSLWKSSTTPSLRRPSTALRG
jgi:SAM-dependent methyltransferase